MSENKESATEIDFHNKMKKMPKPNNRDQLATLIRQSEHKGLSMEESMEKELVRWCEVLHSGTRSFVFKVFGDEVKILKEYSEQFLGHPVWIKKSEVEIIGLPISLNRVLAWLGGLDGVNFYRDWYLGYNGILVFTNENTNDLSKSIGWKPTHNNKDVHLFSKNEKGEHIISEKTVDVLLQLKK